MLMLTQMLLFKETSIYAIMLTLASKSLQHTRDTNKKLEEEKL